MTAAPEGTVQKILFAGIRIFDDVCVDGIYRKLIACFENAGFGNKGAFRAVRDCEENTGLPHAPGRIGAIEAIFFSHLYNIGSPDIMALGPCNRLFRRISDDFSEAFPVQQIFGFFADGSGTVQVIAAVSGVVVNGRIMGHPQTRKIPFSGGNVFRFGRFRRRLLGIMDVRHGIYLLSGNIIFYIIIN